MFGWARALSFALCLLCFGNALAQTPALRGYSATEGWQYLELGTFPQTLEGGLEPILWRVLAVEQNRAYLLSEYVLVNRRIHNDDAQYAQSGGDFTQTEMYAYLNGAFLDSFTAEERALLSPRDGALMTLASVDDLRNRDYGFISNISRGATGTAWAIQNGLFQYGHAFGNTSPYWTCTPYDGVAYAACCTKAGGNIGWIRVVVQNEGCRPACYITLDGITLDGGSGTLANPFRLK